MDWCEKSEAEERKGVIQKKENNSQDQLWHLTSRTCVPRRGEEFPGAFYPKPSKGLRLCHAVKDDRLNSTGCSRKLHTHFFSQTTLRSSCGVGGTLARGPEGRCLSRRLGWERVSCPGAPWGGERLWHLLAGRRPCGSSVHRRVHPPTWRTGKNREEHCGASERGKDLLALRKPAWKWPLLRAGVPVPGHSRRTGGRERKWVFTR